MVLDMSVKIREKKGKGTSKLNIDVSNEELGANLWPLTR